METLGERFQRETKYQRGRRPPASRVLSYPKEFKRYPQASVVRLPFPQEEAGSGVWGVITQRRSIRDFLPKEISLETLARLVWSVGGVRERQGGFLYRVVPSAGALYPVETYIMANRVEGLEKGIYHLYVPTFSLELVVPGDRSEALARAALGQDMVASCSVVFLWTAVTDRCRIKYGERSFRYIYLDAGHMGQNLYLAATAMGLGCCTVGAFFDDEANEVLDVDGLEETVIYLGVVGVPALED